LLSQIGVDDKGNVSEANFASHFDKSLPEDQIQFEQTVAQFMECARGCRQAKLDKRTTDMDDAAAGEDIEEEEEDKEINKDGRLATLRKVFNLFDTGHSKIMKSDDLKDLCTMRRQLNGGGEWTEEKNARLIMKIVGSDWTNGTQITRSNFCEYFERTLPRPPIEFDALIEEFLQAAQMCSDARKHAEEAAAIKAEKAAAQKAKVEDAPYDPATLLGAGYEKMSFPKLKRTVQAAGWPSSSIYACKNRTHLGGGQSCFIHDTRV